MWARDRWNVHADIKVFYGFLRIYTQRNKIKLKWGKGNGRLSFWYVSRHLGCTQTHGTKRKYGSIVLIIPHVRHRGHEQCCKSKKKRKRIEDMYTILIDRILYLLTHSEKYRGKWSWDERRTRAWLCYLTGSLLFQILLNFIAYKNVEKL